MLLALQFLLLPFCGCLHDPDAAQSEGVACETIRGNLAPTSEWETDRFDHWTTVTDLMSVGYNDSVDPETLDFGRSEDSGRRSNHEQWKCGYRYHVWIPSDYAEEVSIPLLIFLHGGLSHADGTPAKDQNPGIPQLQNQSFVVIMPEKKEWDWHPTKIEDILADARENLRLNDSRVHLTGLSMGGRGTLIVAAGLPEEFASITPVCPHHWPTDYRELAPNLAHLPTWISHGDVDDVSRYDWALNMSNLMIALDADVKMTTMEGYGHCNWDLYTEENIGWMMDQQRNHSGQ